MKPLTPKPIKKMIKKILTLIVFAVFCQSITAQKETCDTPTEDVLLDANSITKCSIESSKDKANSKRSAKSFTVEVSSRRRVVRKKTAVSSVASTAESHKINDIKNNASIVGSLSLSKETVIEKVPFNNVEEAPLFKSCEKVAIANQKKCFNTAIYEHINKNLYYPKEAYDNSIQGRVLVQFVIDKTGEVTDLNIRTPYQGELLEEEARRIISKLPKFTPGKHNGKTVKVKYGVPISFKIPGKKPSNVRRGTKKVILKEVHNFANVDQLPMFKNCDSSNDTSEDCFNKNFVAHINKYFAYPLKAAENNIEGKVTAYFVIDANGDIVNIKTRAIAGKELLEKATRKLIEKLPKFTPGKHNDKATNVSHAFPVTFKLH